MASEFERIARLQSIFGQPPRAVSLGIGDDCAIVDLDALQPGASHLVWTVDACVEGVHFRRDLVGWRDVGWRSFMAAASDLAAMGATPIGALCAIAMPASLRDDELEQIAAGQADAARAIGTAMVGGNLSRAGEVSLTTTVIGTCAKAMRRSGAQPGDRVVIAGTPGLAAAGLKLLLDGRSEANAAIEAWRRPVARISDGLELARIATAQIDTSDGLAQDAGHIAEASSVRIELDEEAIVCPELREVCERYGLDAVPLALSGGEDYCVLGTVRPEELGTGNTEGEREPGMPEPEGSMLPAPKLAGGWHGQTSAVARVRSRFIVRGEGAHEKGRLTQRFRVIGQVTEGEGVWIGSRRVDGLGHDHFR